MNGARDGVGWGGAVERREARGRPDRLAEAAQLERAGRLRLDASRA